MSCRDKTIVLGVTGGIACYKSVELLRLLKKEGAHVYVVMTSHAKEFVKPLTFRTLSGNPVATDLFKPLDKSEIVHIKLAQDSDAIVIAPATANIIGKIANGIADDLLSSIVLAANVPLVIAPAMNTYMWENKIFQENLKKLKSLRYKIIEPGEGDLACSSEEKAKGRMAEPIEILSRINALFHKEDLKGEKILITAGPTQEPIDPVRFISNRSSGRMGTALARAAQERGGDVTLIAGPISVEPPKGVKVLRVRTTEEMRKAVGDRFPSSTITIMAAAVCDYRPQKSSLEKIKRTGKKTTILLEETPDILGEIGKKKGTRFVVGFAAETSSLLKNAKKKLKEKNLDLIVANNVSSSKWGFDSEDNKVTLITSKGKVQSFPPMKKIDVAHKVLNAIVKAKGSSPHR